MVDHQFVSKDIIHISCLNCLSVIQHTRNQENSSILCNNCQKEYPIIYGIPILLKDTSSYLSETALILNNYIQESLVNKQEIEKDSNTNIIRRNALKNLALALDSNLELVNNVLLEITPFVSINNLLDRAILFKESRSFGFELKDFRYLRRDWCFLPKCENQLNIIKKTLEPIILEYDSELSSTLILGAGTGRIASDIASLYKRVYAFDRSFSMAYFFKRTIKEDIHFYELTPNNVSHSRNMARLLKASLIPPSNGNASKRLLNNAKKINYFVADAMHIPLINNSLDTVISAYFTDVLALKLYIQEIKRVLKTNGLFIHFGPFDYPFSKISEKLSTDDIKTIFIQNGFEILEDKFEYCHHVESSISMVQYSYYNWVFAARKTEEILKSKAIDITEESIISIRNKIEFVNSGHLSNEGISETATLILSDGSEIRKAGSIISILDFVDGKKRISEIINLMSEEFEINDNTKDTLIQKIKELIDYNVLEILEN